MKKNSMIRKAANSFAGRLLRRVLGEENGQAMMEYIIIGLLIAAACVLGVAFFGNTITGMFASLAHSTTGDHATASNVQNAANAAATTDFTTAKAHVDAKHSGAADANQHAGTQAVY